MGELLTIIAAESAIEHYTALLNTKVTFRLFVFGQVTTKRAFDICNETLHIFSYIIYQFGFLDISYNLTPK